MVLMRLNILHLQSQLNHMNHLPMTQYGLHKFHLHHIQNLIDDI